jgi:hypothetical protein
MQGKWNEWEHSAVNTAAPPPFLTLRAQTPHRVCKQTTKTINHSHQQQTKRRKIKSKVTLEFGTRKKMESFWSVAAVG